MSTVFKQFRAFGFYVSTLFVAACAATPPPPVDHLPQPAAKPTVDVATSQPEADDWLVARMQAALEDSGRTRAARRTAALQDQSFLKSAAEPTKVAGRLAPEIIQRIVRAQFGNFRRCYEDGLRKNPNLSGRVSVRFVIDIDGKVSRVGNGGSDLPDPDAVACVVNSFGTMVFPKPDGGIVTVVYPIMFSPGDDDKQTTGKEQPSNGVKPKTQSAPVLPAQPAPTPPHAGVARNQSVGPIVEILANGIFARGAKVGDPRSVAELGRPQKIDALFDALNAEREKWKSAHPDEVFPGIAGLRADGGTQVLTFKSVFQTMAFAGYPNIFVQSAEDPSNIVELGAQVPPLEPPGTHIEPVPHAMLVLFEPDEGALIWKKGPTVMTEERISRANLMSRPILCESWKKNALQRAENDDQQELLLILTANDSQLGPALQMAKMAETCQRNVLGPDGRTQSRPVFWSVFSVR